MEPYNPTWKDEARAFAYQTGVLYIVFLIFLTVLPFLTPIVAIALFIIRLPGNILGFMLTRTYLEYVKKHPQKYSKEVILSKRNAKTPSQRVGDGWKPNLKF